MDSGVDRAEYYSNGNCSSVIGGNVPTVAQRRVPLAAAPPPKIIIIIMINPANAPSSRLPFTFLFYFILLGLLGIRKGQPRHGSSQAT